MFKKALLASAFVACGVQAQVDVPITGNVESKCVIVTDTPGVYGNPLSNLLSTSPQNGGVLPIVRYDIIEANSYKAQITWPQSFTTSPVLNDLVNWTGSVELSDVSDASMSDFETSKIEWENVTEYDLTIAGSAWFKINSEADYGYDKSFPGGQYRASVLAECIAK